MDFELSEEQRAFQVTARTFARDEMMPNARTWDEGEIFPSKRYARLRRWFRRYLCEGGCGGSALSRLDAALIFEELAQGCTSTAAYISIHNMAAWMIDAFGSAGHVKGSSEALRHGSLRELLPDRARGGVRCREFVHTCASRRNHYVLDGSKAFISGGGVSDIYVVMARTGEAVRAAYPVSLWRRDTGPVVRRAGKEARLENTADRHGQSSRIAA
jgi:alkylation response protein AidB-like acyl-CoA dehydrogenase